MIEYRLSHKTTISENQFGFMPTIFLLKHLKERYKEVNKEPPYSFYWPREIIWQVTWRGYVVIFKKKKRVTFMYIKLTKDIYDKVVTRKRTKKDITSKFPILIGLHQG